MELLNDTLLVSSFSSICVTTLAQSWNARIKISSWSCLY